MIDESDDLPPATAEERAHFRRTLVKVMIMQVVALAFLWLLQSRYAN